MAEESCIDSKVVKVMDRVHLVKEFANIVVVVVVDFALWVDSILQVEVVEMSRRRLEMVEEVVEMSRYMVEEEMVAEVMVVVVVGMSKYMAEEEMVGEVMVVVVEGML